MHTCDECGYELDASAAPLPSRCPRCGAPTTSSASPSSNASSTGRPLAGAPGKISRPSASATMSRGTLAPPSSPAIGGRATPTLYGILDASTMTVSRGNAAVAEKPTNSTFESLVGGAEIPDLDAPELPLPAPQVRAGKATPPPFTAPRMRRPTPPPVTPSSARYGEIDLPGLPVDDADLPALPASPASSAMPSINMDADLDLPQPRGAQSTPRALSNRMPAGKVAPPDFSDLPMPALDDDLPGLPFAANLPVPSQKAPTRAVNHRSSFDDLPEPVRMEDLPAPLSGLDLPMPSSGSIDLPMPGGMSDLPMPGSMSDLPMPGGSLNLPMPSSGSIDLPMPGGVLDLPLPSFGDLPLPSSGSLPQPALDLPRPSADQGMPSPRAASNLPRPGQASNLPQSAAAPDTLEPESRRVPPRTAGGQRPPPPPPNAARRPIPPRAADKAPFARAAVNPAALSDGLDIDSLPAIEDLDLDLGGPAPRPAALESRLGAQDPKAVQAAIALNFDPAGESLAQAQLATPAANSNMPPRSYGAPAPAPKRVAREQKRPIPKPVLYAGGSLLLLTLGGVGGYMMLAQTSEAPPSARQAPVIRDQTSKIVVNPATLANWAAALDVDSPEGYRQAIAAAQQSGDSRGQHEAGLLLHLRYGPEPTLLSQARSATGATPPADLQDHRIMALVELADHRPDRASARLAPLVASDGSTKPDPLAQLYYAWATREQGHAHEALGLAKSAVASRDTLVLAQILVAGLTCDLTDPRQGLADDQDRGLIELAKQAQARPDHLGWQLAWIDGMASRGQWRQAQEVANKLSEQPSVASNKMPIYLKQAQIARLQGNLALALGKLDGALATQAQALPPKLARIELLLDLGDLAAAQSEIERLRLASNPGPRVLEMAARVALARGESEQVDRLLEQLAVAYGLQPAPSAKSGDSTKGQKTTPPASPTPAPTDSATIDPSQRLAHARLHWLRGENLAMKLNVDKAMSELDQARRLDPTLISTYFTQVKLLERAGRLDRALKFLQDSRSALPSIESAAIGTPPIQGDKANDKPNPKSGQKLERKADPEAPSGDTPAANQAAVLGVDPWIRQSHGTLLRLQAQVAQGQGEIARAKLALQAAHAIDTTDNATRLALAKNLLANRQEDAAQAMLLQLNERTNGMPGLTGPLSQVLMQRGQLPELEQLIGGQLDDPRVSDEILLSGTRLRLAQGQADAAIALAERALQRRQDNWEAHLLKAQALMAKDDYTAARSELDLAQAREPQAEVELWRARSDEALGKTEAAIATYARALQIDPRLDSARVARGLLLARNGSAREVIVELEPLVKKGGSGQANANAHLALGIAYKDLRELERSLQHLRAASEADDTLFEAFYLEGRIASDLNRHGSAAAALIKALAQSTRAADPRQALDAQRMLGREYEALQKKSEARAAYQRYLEIAPANDSGRAQVERALRNL